MCLLVAAACSVEYSAKPHHSVGDGDITPTDGAVFTGTDGGVLPNPPNQPFVALGPTGSCFVSAAGTAKCAGDLQHYYCVDVPPDPQNPQLPTQECTTRPFPLADLALPANVRKVLISHNVFCVLAGTDSLSLSCAGNNAGLQLGATATPDEDPFLPLRGLTGMESGIDDAILGLDYLCVLKAGAVSCWGAGIDNAPLSAPKPAPVPEAVVELAGGSQFRCARTASGDAYCWGYSVTPRKNASDPISNADAPVLVDTQGKVAALSASPNGRHVCALGRNGVVSCWGDDSSSQVGMVSRTFVDKPTAVSAVSPGALRVGAGTAHSCAIRSNGSVYCWGDANNGALGDGTSTVATPTPVLVSGLDTGASRLFVGGNAACALVGSESTSAFKCWGDNSAGKLQNGNSTAQKTPVIVPIPN